MFVIKGEHFFTYHDSGGGYTWWERFGFRRPMDYKLRVQAC